MLYQRRTFTVPASAGSAAECERVGHTEPDAHGKCLRCAARIEATITLHAGDRVTYERVLD